MPHGLAVMTGEDNDCERDEKCLANAPRRPCRGGRFAEQANRLDRLVIGR
jgi:hypothetical protein